MKKIAFIAILAALTLVAAQPAPFIGKQETRYMSRAYGPDKAYDVQVSTVMRNYAKDHKYMPLIVQVHNWEAGNVHVSPRQFVLKNANGDEFTPISVDEYFESHKIQGRRNIKYLSRRADNGIETKPEIWYIERSNFYPAGSSYSGKGVYDDVNLRPNFYMVDWLYFPQMDNGEYQLVYTSANGDELIMPLSL